jgi:glycosyltransferase involved in cell wall biosynthesis
LRGLPVIATKSGGPLELINKNNGLLVELQNKEIGLFNALLNLMTNYETYNLDQIKSDAIKKFNNQKVIDEYFKIYSTVSYS